MKKEVEFIVPLVLSLPILLFKHVQNMLGCIYFYRLTTKLYNNSNNMRRRRRKNETFFLLFVAINIYVSLSVAGFAVVVTNQINAFSVCVLAKLAREKKK